MWRVGHPTHASCKRDSIKMRDYIDRQVIPPKRVTSPTWGLLPPCKQALCVPSSVNIIAIDVANDDSNTTSSKFGHR